jgi:single-strand DNA-binding protein
MKSYARATLLGNVGNDVVLRHTRNGKPVANLSIATNERRKDGPDLCTWHRVVLWDQLADIAHKYVRKGSLVLVEGSVTSSEWVDANGQHHTRTEVIARELVLLPAGDQGAASRGRDEMPPALDVDAGPTPVRPRGQAEDGEEREIIEEDLPF